MQRGPLILCFATCSGVLVVAKRHSIRRTLYAKGVVGNFSELCKTFSFFCRARAQGAVRIYLQIYISSTYILGEISTTASRQPHQTPTHLLGQHLFWYYIHQLTVPRRQNSTLQRAMLFGYSWLQHRKPARQGESSMMYGYPTPDYGLGYVGRAQRETKRSSDRI